MGGKTRWGRATFYTFSSAIILVGAVWVAVHPDSSTVIKGLVTGIGAGFAALVGADIGNTLFDRLFPRSQAIIEKRAARIAEIEAKVDQEPARVRYAWELASAKLEQYFDRNLEQVRSIYKISVIAMSAGFIVILFGVIMLMVRPEAVTSAAVVSGSGVITEFIGAMFMLIYRSTMQQAGSYVQTLERINTVGMATQILDTMTGDDSGHLKDSTKAELVRLLVSPKAEEGAKN